MRFRHALIHPSALARAETAAWRTAVRVACPLCAQPYYAATLRGLWREPELGLLNAAVEAYLARERPDHAHSFELEPARGTAGA